MSIRICLVGFWTYEQGAAATGSSPFRTLFKLNFFLFCLFYIEKILLCILAEVKNLNSQVTITCSLFFWKLELYPE